jgi:hypothetical protein
MKREERVLKIPPLAISSESGDALLNELSRIANDRRNAEFEQRLRTAFQADRAGVPKLDPEARTEDEFVQRNRDNQEFWRMANIPTYQSYIFLAKSGNVSFDDTDFSIGDLPKDLLFVKARADGTERFIEVQLKTDFRDFNDIRNWQTRQLIVQGQDRNWVTGVYERLKLLADSEQLTTRSFIYGNILKVFWATILLVLFAEYRAVRWLRPGFSLTEPLSGTGALLMFGVLLATLLVVAEFGIAMLTFWFPYFEVEGNTSRGRMASRKLVASIASTIYTGAVVNALILIFGPVLASALGNH